MVPDDNGFAHEFVDHIADGRRVAAKLGLMGSDFVLTTSLGRDEKGRGQVLVLGGQIVLLAPTDGSDGPVEMHRTHIRSVEAVPGQGLLLRAPGHRWLHRLADAEASYLRDLFVESPLIPPTGRGGSCIPEQGWNRDQIAQFVGLVVMRAAEAEHCLSLVASYGREPGTFDRDVFGQTGKRLESRLDEIGKTSAAVADMAERYRAWSDRRNQLVHSVRSTMEDGRADPRTARPTLMKKGTPPEDLYTVESQDLPDLVDMWLAFNWLYHDAWRAYVNLVTGVEAKDMPLPNSVSGSARLPASQHDQEPEARDLPRQDATST